MKKMLLAALAAAVLAGHGCSGGGSDPGAAPAIYNLVVFPREFPVGAGGGAVSVTLLFNVSDPDGDVVRCLVTGPEGPVESPLRPPIEGVEIGVVAVPIVVPTGVAAVKPYTLVAVDAEGNTSNTLNFTITIR